MSLPSQEALQLDILTQSPLWGRTRHVALQALMLSFSGLPKHIQYPLVLGGNAFMLLGGGLAVVNNMFFVVLADVTPANER